MSRLIGFSIITFLCIVSFTVGASAETGGVWFGAQTQIWPWMWRGGLPLKAVKGLDISQIYRWRFYVANLDHYSHSHFRWNLVILRQGKDGTDNWSRARAIVEEQRRRGIETVFRLLEDPEIYLVDNTNRKRIEELLGKYQRWVRSLATVFRGKVKYYVISNEIDHNYGANLLHHKHIIADYRRYRALLHTAYRAIKQEDPSAEVIDHGVSAYSLGLAVADDLWTRKGVREALAFWKRFNFGHIGNVGLVPFMRMMTKKDSKRRIEIAKHTFSQQCECDYHQFHWYFNPDVLDAVLQWIDVRGRAGGARPLFVTELGYRMPTRPGKGWDGRDMNVADYSRYSQMEHAESVVKAVALLVGHGVRNIEYWQLRMHHNRDTSAQLYLPTKNIDEFIPTKALAAYERMVQLLEVPLMSSKCTTLKGITDCKLRRQQDMVRVVWAYAGVRTLKIKSSILAQFDYMGRKIGRSASRDIRLSEQPKILIVSNVPAQ